MSNIYNKLLTDEQKELYSLMLPVYGASATQKTYRKILNISLKKMKKNHIISGVDSYLAVETIKLLVKNIQMMILLNV